MLSSSNETIRGPKKKKREEEVKVCSAAPAVTYIFSQEGTTSSQRQIYKNERGKKNKNK
jgi:hypothetical protein